MIFINVSQASMHTWPSFLVRAGVAGTGAIVGVPIPKRRVTNKVGKSACGGRREKSSGHKMSFVIV